MCAVNNLIWLEFTVVSIRMYKIAISRKDDSGKSIVDTNGGAYISGNINIKDGNL